MVAMWGCCCQDFDTADLQATATVLESGAAVLANFSSAYVLSTSQQQGLEGGQCRCQVFAAAPHALQSCPSTWPVMFRDPCGLLSV